MGLAQRSPFGLQLRWENARGGERDVPSRLRPPSPPVRWERLSSPHEQRVHLTQAVSTRCRQWASWEGARSARGEPGEGSTAAATLSCPGRRGSGGRVCFLGCFTNTLVFQKNSPDHHPAARLQFPPLQVRAQAAESVKKTEARSKVPASAATGMLRAASSPHACRGRGRGGRCHVRTSSLLTPKR